MRNLSGAHPFDGARVANILPGDRPTSWASRSRTASSSCPCAPGSTAARLGFKPGDVIVSRSGREKIENVDELEALLKERQRMWQMVVKRGNQVLQLQVPG